MCAGYQHHFGAVRAFLFVLVFSVLELGDPIGPPPTNFDFAWADCLENVGGPFGIGTEGEVGAALVELKIRLVRERVKGRLG